MINYFYDQHESRRCRVFYSVVMLSDSRIFFNVLNLNSVVWQLATNLLVSLFDACFREIDVELAKVEQQKSLDNDRKSALNAFSEIEQYLDNGWSFAKRKSALEDVY